MAMIPNVVITETLDMLTANQRLCCDIIARLDHSPVYLEELDQMLDKLRDDVAHVERSIGIVRVMFDAAAEHPATVHNGPDD